MTDKRVVERVHREVARVLRDSGFAKRELLVVAVSGGPDSLTLLYSLNALRDSFGLQLHGAHLNHGLRGADADEDAEFVAKTLQSLGLPCTVERAEVAAFRAKERLSLEEAARKVRYLFLSRVAAEVGASAVALGHTSDDQAETILMNLLRGTGLSGLRGIALFTSAPMVSDMPEITALRPLLNVTREETEAYCRAQGLSPRRDETNLSSRFTRNRLRNELLPLLQQYNPNIKDSLLRLSRSAAEDLAYIEKEVDKAWAGVITERPRGLELDRSAFSSLDTAIQHHLLRRAVNHVKGDLGNVERNHIQNMARLMQRGAGKSLDLPGQVTFSVSYATATLSSVMEEPCPLPPLDGEHRLNIQGETLLPGWQVSAVVPDPESASCYLLREEQGRGDSYSAVLSLEATGRELWIRRRRPGDRFQPLGMAQEKKLQNFMVDSKIPRSWRDRIPLVVSPRGIVWVVGYRIAEWAQVQEATTGTIRLHFQR
ncbi:MAG: tRNA lysidine(34) synthetase TilS [Chloroflexi bacterium]|nr:tRNA lysidine(34) synthetase TilS [Chloroflexota bacterium]